MRAVVDTLKTSFFNTHSLLHTNARTRLTDTLRCCRVATCWPPARRSTAWSCPTSIEHAWRSQRRTSLPQVCVWEGSFVCACMRACVVQCWAPSTATDTHPLPQTPTVHHVTRTPQAWCLAWPRATTVSRCCRGGATTRGGWCWAVAWRPRVPRQQTSHTQRGCTAAKSLWCASAQTARRWV
jgi:hypothetical protein